jgi:hypothetical protein
LAVIGVVVGLVMAVASYVAHAIGAFEHPSDDRLIAEFAAHRPLFEAVRERAAHDPELESCGAGLWGLGAWCTGRDQAAYRSFFAKTGSNRLSPDYDGRIAIGFAGDGLLAIGPGWSKGIMFVPGDPNRAGQLVHSTGGANHLPEGVYIRPIRDRWYVFYQRDD